MTGPETRPADRAPAAAHKHAAAKRIEAARADLLRLSHRIHARPKLAFAETQAAAWCADALRRKGRDNR